MKVRLLFQPTGAGVLEPYDCGDVVDSGELGEEVAASLCAMGVAEEVTDDETVQTATPPEPETAAAEETPQG
jgi:hypothetical protein